MQVSGLCIKTRRASRCVRIVHKHQRAQVAECSTADEGGAQAPAPLAVCGIAQA
jgi:hypothetical protein